MSTKGDRKREKARERELRAIEGSIRSAIQEEIGQQQRTSKGQKIAIASAAAAVIVALFAWRCPVRPARDPATDRASIGYQGIVRHPVAGTDSLSPPRPGVTLAALIWNSGSRVARGINTASNWRLGQCSTASHPNPCTPQMPKDPFSTTAGLPNYTSDIAPQHGEGMELNTGSADPDWDENEKKCLDSGGFTYFVYGYVTYWDEPRTTPHWTAFCQQWDPNLRTLGTGHWISCESHNEMDKP